MLKKHPKTKNNRYIPSIFKLPKIHDPRGNLTFVEGGAHLPFEIRRVYWIYDVPGGEKRGGHAYKTLHEMVIAVSGSFSGSLCSSAFFDYP